MDDRDDYDEDDRSDQVRNALVKAVAVIAGIAVLIALGTVIVVRALGLDQGETAGPVGSGASESRKPLPTTALPVPGEESQSPTDEPSEKPRGKGRIELSISPVSARPNERVNLTGTYRGADNVGLRVQRFEEGAWRDFGVDATVRVGTYETWVMTGRPGEHRFRVWDPAARRGSNVVLVTIG
jgi:hypothetical protein